MTTPISKITTLTPNILAFIQESTPVNHKTPNSQSPQKQTLHSPITSPTRDSSHSTTSLNLDIVRIHLHIHLRLPLNPYSLTQMHIPCVQGLQLMFISQKPS